MELRYNFEFEIKFTVKNVIDRKENGRDVLSIKIDEYSKEYEDKYFKPTTVKAYGSFLSVYEWDTFISKAKFIEDDNGYHIELLNIPTLIIPSSAKAITKIAIKQIENVSEKSMKKLGDTLGENFISILNNNPERIKEIKGLSLEQQENILEWCQGHEDVERIVSELLSYGIAPKTTARIYKDYGLRSLYEINENPYALYYYGSAQYKEVDSIVAMKGIFEINSLKRLECAVYAILKDAENSGHTCYPRDELVNLINKFIKVNKGFEEDYEFSQQSISRAVNKMIEKGQVISYQILDNGEQREILYRNRTFINEDSVAKFIADRYEKKSYIGESKFYSEFIEKVLNENKQLGDKQKEAVIKSLTNRLSVINGGPGTGKTFTIKAIIDILTKFYQEILDIPKDEIDEKKICLVAPTGKAASRISELTKCKASTIHSALSLSLDKTQRRKEKVLKHEWLIIDEGSMVDSELFAYLCSHVDKKTNIIICGDSAQLPSVGPGAVLDQIIKGQLCARTELERIYRQKRSDKEKNLIIDNAFIIRNSTDINSLNNLELPEISESFSFLEEENDFKISEKILKIYKKLLKQNIRIEDILILSPIHNSEIGTDYLNKLIQEEINGDEVDKITGTKVFKKGDRVIQLANDYKLNIYNGDVGFITEILKNQEGYSIGIEVKFDEKEEVVQIYDLKDIDLAYALTVHKSQGSEAQYVIMPFSNSRASVFMLSNRLIYTGLTRAKKKFIAVGLKRRFISGCLQSDRFSRKTLLSYMTHKKISKD